MKPTRGGMARARVSALAFAAALAACGGESPPVQQTPRGSVEVGSFVGEYSAATGELTITPTGVDPFPMGLVFTGTIEEITVSQNGIWGDVGDNAVEMRTVGGTVHTYAGGCSPNPVFLADVQIHSGFSAYRLERVHVQITSTTPSGFGSCLGITSPDPLVSVASGVFPYDDIAPGGSATATWSFALPSAGDFRFFGKVWAERVEQLPPVTSASLAAGAYTAPQALALDCIDPNALSSGCAGTFYTVDGGSTQPYTAPIRLSGSQTICYWSVDLRGNTETPATCRAYTVTSGAVTASQFGLGAPQCETLGASCTTGTRVAGIGTAEDPDHGTIDGCTDGVTGAGDTEYVTSVTIATTDGGPLAPGRPVRVSATVNSPWQEDVFTVYYATTTTSPTWVSAGTGALVRGVQDVGVSFTLPAGVIAVRAQLAWGSPIGACGLSGFDDEDDLVFVTDVAAPGATPATVSLTAPATGSVSRKVLLTATASDDVAVRSVRFEWRESTGTGTWSAWRPIATDTSPPWAAEWDSGNAVYGSSVAQLAAVATDSDGLETYSAPVGITIQDKTAPTVSLTSPTSGVSLSRGVAMTLSGIGQDANGLNLIDYYVDGVSRLHYTYMDPSYSGTWDPSGLDTNVPHSAFMRISDQANNYSQTPAVQFTVY